MSTLSAPHKISQVGIVAKSHLRAAAPHLVGIVAWLRERGIEPILESATAALLPSAAVLMSSSDVRRVAEKIELVEKVDMIVVLGGDGTLLSVADSIAGAGKSIPILGVNFGSLGFLTEVTLPELYTSLETVLSGKARIEERLMLASTVRRAHETFATHVALNDVVVTKTARARMIDLSVSVGDEFVTRVRADGLIVATPTGSTAYNLAAGGPIVQPSVDALILTPIAPHTLTNRPIIIPASSTVRVQPHMDRRDEVFITFDGQAGFQLEEGDEISICRAERTLHLIRPSTRSYFEVLRQKLKWGEAIIKT
jgi:NAD+ kinase